MRKKFLPWLVAISVLAATLHFNMSYSDHQRQFNVDLQSEINLTGHTR